MINLLSHSHWVEVSRPFVLPAIWVQHRCPSQPDTDPCKKAATLMWASLLTMEKCDIRPMLGTVEAHLARWLSFLTWPSPAWLLMAQSWCIRVELVAGPGTQLSGGETLGCDAVRFPSGCSRCLSWPQLFGLLMSRCH